MNTLQLFVGIEFGWLLLCYLLFSWGYVRRWKGDYALPSVLLVLGSLTIVLACIATLLIQGVMA